MRKSIQRLLLILSRFSSDVSEYFEKLGRTNGPVAPAPDAGQEQALVVEKMVPLAVERPVIQVECISCGSVVELSGICQKCQGPICREGFCRKNVHDEEMDMWVIQCRNCAVTEPA